MAKIALLWHRCQTLEQCEIQWHSGGGSTAWRQGGVDAEVPAVPGGHARLGAEDATAARGWRRQGGQGAQPAKGSVCSGFEVANHADELMNLQ